MINFCKVLSAFFALFFSLIVFGEIPVRLEVKAFDNNTVYIFYHSREQQVKISANGNLVNASLSIPTTLEIVNQFNFNEYANTPVLSTDQKAISFSVKGEFVSHSVIIGEKLTAIKFRDKASNTESLDEALKNINITPVSNDKRANNDSVIYETIKDSHILSFDFPTKNVGMTAFFRGKYLWIVFDKHKEFTLSDNKIFQNFKQLDNSEYTILRTKISSDYNNVVASKKGTRWSLTVVKTKSHAIGNIIDFHISEKGESVNILNNFNNNTVIDIQDPEIGDLLKIIPLKIAGTRVKKKYETLSFSVIPSIQGVAIAINADDVEFTKKKDSLEIISKTVTHTSGSATPISTSRAVELLGLMKYGSLLPILDKKLDIADFSYNNSRFIREISQAQNNQDIFVKRLEYAKFLFMHGMYRESLAALNSAARTTAKEYNYSLYAQFLAAVNNTLQGSLDDAKDLYANLLRDLDALDAQEIVLWNNYNNFLIGNSNDSIGFLSNLNKSINLYPDNLYWPFALAEIEVRLFSNNLKGTEVIFKDLRTPIGTNLNSLKFYKAIYYRKKEQLNLAKQFLQELVAKDQDPYNKVRAEMELVKLELSNKEISMSDAIKRLNDVRFIWRGDKVEYDLLTQVATYYRDSGDATNALRTYKYIQTVFNNDINNFYITSEMVKIFNNVFLPGGTATDLDDFTAVALFYEFKDLNPIGAQGDEVILSIARLLMKLDLLDSAITLLRHQINYRLSGEKRIINADHLAIILLLDKKPQEAIQVLDQTDQDNFRFNEHEYRIRLKAKALIDLKKYSEALSYLKNDPTDDAKILRKEALFKTERWQDYIEVQEQELAQLVNIPIEDAFAQDVLRLAIAYYMQNNQIGLESLDKNSNITNETLKNIIDLLLTSSTPIDYKDLDKTLSINQMQALLDKYKNQIFNP